LLCDIPTNSRILSVYEEKVKSGRNLLRYLVSRAYGRYRISLEDLGTIWERTADFFVVNKLCRNCSQRHWVNQKRIRGLLKVDHTVEIWFYPIHILPRRADFVLASRNRTNSNSGEAFYASPIPGRLVTLRRRMCIRGVADSIAPAHILSARFGRISW